MDTEYTETNRCVFWDVILRNVLKFNRRFGNHVTSNFMVEEYDKSASKALESSHMLGEFFEYEDRGGMVLRNVRSISTGYTL
jgi:hypothetical protein